MKKILVALTLLVSSIAFARQNTIEMTCAEARQLVNEKGALVISLGKPYVYDRVVAHSGYCSISEFASPKWAPTQDSNRCFIGYTCEANDSVNN